MIFAHSPILSLGATVDGCQPSIQILLPYTDVITDGKNSEKSESTNVEISSIAGINTSKQYYNIPGYMHHSYIVHLYNWLCMRISIFLH